MYRSTSFPLLPPLINWPVHRTFPGLRHCIYPYPPKNSLIFFFFPKNTFFVIFCYIFSQSFVLFRKPFKPIYRSSFFFSTLPLPLVFSFFLCSCSFLFYFLRVIAFGSVGVKRGWEERVEWMKGVEQKKKEGRRDTVDGRTLFCIASLMAISMIFFSAENIKSLRYLLQSQSGNDLPGNLHGENFLLLPFLLLLLFFA